MSEVRQSMAALVLALIATWPAMRQHVQIMADTLTTALVKQFPNKFS